MKTKPVKILTFTKNVLIENSADNVVDGANLKQHLNFAFFNDVNCNKFEKGGYITKYPEIEKIRPFFEDAHYNISKSFTVKLKLDLFSDGTIKLHKKTTKKKSNIEIFDPVVDYYSKGDKNYNDLIKEEGNKYNSEFQCKNFFVDKIKELIKLGYIFSYSARDTGGDNDYLIIDHTNKKMAFGENGFPVPKSL